MARLHGVAARAEFGVATVELAISSLLLIPIVAGAIDGGLLMHASRQNADAIRSAARSASQPCVGSVGCSAGGNPDDADRRAITALALQLNEQATSIRKVIVYRAANANDKVPAECLSSTQSGVAGKCNIYRNPVNASGMTVIAEGTSWPTASRIRGFGFSDYVGVWADIRHESAVGLVFPKNMDLTNRAVFRLEPPALRSARLPDLDAIPQAPFGGTWADWTAGSGGGGGTSSVVVVGNGAG